MRGNTVLCRNCGMLADGLWRRRIALFFFLAWLLGGCGTMSNGRGWGQDATLAPGWERIGRAAKDAALATETWAPAAGAVALQIGHADAHIQTWAAEHTPVFGSQENADRMSNNLLRASGALWVASGLAAPSGSTAGDDAEWLSNKARGLGVQAGTGALLRSTVGILKDSTKRTRPNGLGESSFPSNHASQAAVFSTMTSKNIDTFGWSEETVSATRIGLGTLTAATSWARVEANQHYPSDVLAGVALGHFFGAFFTEAFLRPGGAKQVQVVFEPLQHGHMMLVRFGL